MSYFVIEKWKYDDFRLHRPDLTTGCCLYAACVPWNKIG